jgi:tRNA(adenine34) deaminase
MAENLLRLSGTCVITCAMGKRKPSATPPGERLDFKGTFSERDAELMRALVRFTARTLPTASPVPFGALVADTASGTVLLRSLNAVRRELDPSSHAELRAVRKATRKLGRISLKGFTLFTTCEPCPMCMGNALWAGLDRVVYGATIDDANQFCRQIHVPARELSKRSDMPIRIDGPFLRDECVALFTHPNMQKAFATWNPKGPWKPTQRRATA